MLVKIFIKVAKFRLLERKVINSFHFLFNKYLLCTKNHTYFTYRFFHKTFHNIEMIISISHLKKLNKVMSDKLHESHSWKVAKPWYDPDFELQILITWNTCTLILNVPPFLQVLVYHCEAQEALLPWYTSCGLFLMCTTCLALLSTFVGDLCTSRATLLASYVYTQQIHNHCGLSWWYKWCERRCYVDTYDTFSKFSRITTF